MLINKSTGGSGTAFGETFPEFGLTGTVTDWLCVTSELWLRLENASEVVGTQRSAKTKNNPQCPFDFI
jgi:hypothetical protein